jgi:diacylglycerol kinase (ATP)
VQYARGRRVIIERTDGLPLVAESDGPVLEVGSRLRLDIVPNALLALAAADGPCR